MERDTPSETTWVCVALLDVAHVAGEVVLQGDRLRRDGRRRCRGDERRAVSQPLDGLFNRETYTATGAVVLRKLGAEDEFVVAKGTFDVPLVVCNGRPRAYPERSKGSDLLSTCDDLGDEKATLLVHSEVEAVIDLAELGADDVTIDGTSIEVKLPAPTLRRPTVDAGKGVTIVALDTSILPGQLPDDYLSRAAKAGKDAVSKVAGQSGLREIGMDSARSIFERLLRSFGFQDIKVTVDRPPSP